MEMNQFLSLPDDEKDKLMDRIKSDPVTFGFLLKGYTKIIRSHVEEQVKSLRAELVMEMSEQFTLLADELTALERKNKGGKQ